MGLLGAAIRGGQHVARTQAPPRRPVSAPVLRHALGVGVGTFHRAVAAPRPVQRVSRPAARPVPLQRALRAGVQAFHRATPRPAPTPRQSYSSEQQIYRSMFAPIGPLDSSSGVMGIARNPAIAQRIALALNSSQIAGATISKATRIAQAENAYAQIARNQFNRERPFLPAGARMPTIGFAATQAAPGTGIPMVPELPWAGQTYGPGNQGRRPVEFSPATAMQAVENVPVNGPPAMQKFVKQDRGYARQVPLHEYAHVFQSPRVFSTRPLAEGGAEAFKRYVAKHLREQQFMAPGYGGFVGDVQRQRGRTWILRGQFGQ